MTTGFLGFGTALSALEQEATDSVREAKLDFLAKIAARVRFDGEYISRSAQGYSYDDNGHAFRIVPTVDLVAKGDHPFIEDADRQMAQDALAWASDPARRDGDFGNKLFAYAVDEYFTDKQHAVLAYAVGGLIRERAKIAREANDARRAEVAKSNGATHLGTVGQRGTFGPLTVRSLRGFQGGFGWTTAITFEAEDGSEAVWFNTGQDAGLDEGDVVTIEAMVKKHGEYKGLPQTTFNRVKVGANPMAEERARKENEAFRAQREERVRQTDLLADAKTDEELVNDYYVAVGSHPGTLDYLQDSLKAEAAMRNAKYQLERRGLPIPEISIH